MASETATTERRHHSSHWGKFSAEVRDGRVVGVADFPDDPHPSPLIHAIPSALYAQSRVARPMVRKGWLEKGPGGDRELRGAQPFVPVSWERALDLVSAELARVRREHGHEAIFGGSYGWSSAGKFHHARTQLQRFLNVTGGFTAQTHNYSVAAALTILPHVLGAPLGMGGDVTSWEAIAANTKLMVLFGGLPLRNTQVSPGGNTRHRTEWFLKQALAEGAEFVSISPIRADGPDFLGAQQIAPRPNTDTALMLGLAHTLVAEGLHDKDFLERYCVGFERFEDYLLGRRDGQPKDAAWAADISEVEAETIRALARRMAATRTMISTTYSLQRGDHGEQPFWMTVTLAALLGQIGLPGGGFGFGYGSMGGTGEPRAPVPEANLSIGKNPVRSAIPVARITDMLLNPGGRYHFNGEQREYPDIRLIYWCGGNPFHHHQDLNRLVKAWRRPETVIVNEPWWTATARHADIVLPATTSLERNDVGANGYDPYILAMEKAVEPLGEARNDFDIFSDLAGRAGVGQAFTEGRDEANWLRHLYDQARGRATEQGVEYPTFDAFWEKGFALTPPPAEPHVSLKGFRDDPRGHPLKTPSGKIEIFSETIAGFGYDDCPGHPVWLEPAEWLGSPAAVRYPLHMISNQPATRLHAQLDDATLSRESKIRGREPLTIHPGDATARGVADGDLVRVFNDRGALLAGAIVSDTVRPGVIQLATGAWFDPAEPGKIGSLEKHGNPNVLTLDRGSSRLAQAPIAQTALVEVEKFEGEPPRVTAHQPPPTA
ncbi:MAG: molybdopterin guanine dinucleotide-containing S/N-oxide reductase [bacterium]